MYASDEQTVITSPEKCGAEIASHFTPQFHNPELPSSLFLRPAPLDYPITVEEVEKAIMKLSNGKACGYDGIPAELLKYGRTELGPQIAEIFNNLFEKGINIKAISHGMLIPLLKPSKPAKEKSSLRPITLLTVLRKTLSLLTLERIQEKVKEQVSPNQSGFRKGRSTTDCLWTHRFLAATALRCKSKDDKPFKIHITGIDFSKAFDTINRQKLIEILKKNHYREDHIRMITLLLSDTSLAVKYEQHLGAPFNSNNGTPQGDGLSPVLFIIYLSAVIEDLEDNLPLTFSMNDDLDITVNYADDLDFINTDSQKLQMIEEIAPAIFAKWNLKMNISKTEYTTIQRSTTAEVSEWRRTKKLGSLLGDAEDVQRRMNSSRSVEGQLWKIFSNEDHLPENERLKVYNTYIRPVLLYNSSTWGITQTLLSKIESFHRQQLRRKVVKVFYPRKISNSELYRRTNSQPIGIDILQSRWKQFRRMLLLPMNTPPQKAMDFYYQTIDNLQPGEKFKGKQIKCLPIVLNDDLSRIGLSLKTTVDLNDIRMTATNAVKWDQLVEEILMAYKGHQAEHPN